MKHPLPDEEEVVMVVVVELPLPVIGIGAAMTDAPRHDSKTRQTCSFTIVMSV